MLKKSRKNDKDILSDVSKDIADMQNDMFDLQALSKEDFISTHSLSNTVILGVICLIVVVILLLICKSWVNEKNSSNSPSPNGSQA